MSYIIQSVAFGGKPISVTATIDKEAYFYIQQRRDKEIMNGEHSLSLEEYIGYFIMAYFQKELDYRNYK
jgi:hypothetical protein